MAARRGAYFATFEQVRFDHPVYILYSSGTTGVPKCIVHGAGGHPSSAQQGAHPARRPAARDDTFFYFTTTGWMMWNWQVTGLITVGAKLVLVRRFARAIRPSKCCGGWPNEEGVTHFRDQREVHRLMS